MKKLIEYAKMVRDVVYYAYGGVGIVLITVLAAMIGSVWNGVDGFNGATTPAEVELIVGGILICNIIIFLSMLISQYHMKNVGLKAVLSVSQMISLSMMVVLSIDTIATFVPETYVILPIHQTVIGVSLSYISKGIMGIVIVVLLDYAVYIIELFEMRKNNE